MEACARPLALRVRPEQVAHPRSTGVARPRTRTLPLSFGLPVPRLTPYQPHVEQQHTTVDTQPSPKKERCVPALRTAVCPSHFAFAGGARVAGGARGANLGEGAMPKAGSSGL